MQAVDAAEAEAEAEVSFLNSQIGVEKNMKITLLAGGMHAAIQLRRASGLRCRKGR